MEDQERYGDRLKVLQDEDEHEHQGCHQDDHSGPHSAGAGSSSNGSGGRARDDLGPRLRGRWLRPARPGIIVRVRHRPFTAGSPVACVPKGWLKTGADRAPVFIVTNQRRVPVDEISASS